MHGERAPFLTKEPIFKFVMAPNKELSNDVDGPSTKGVEMDLMALSYDPKEGWVASNFGPNSGHWTILVMERNKPKGKKKKKKEQNLKNVRPNPDTRVGSKSYRVEPTEGSETICA